MKRRLWIIILILGLVCVHYSFLNVEAITSASGKSAEDSGGKLIVSMVYDDSESMRISGDGTREAYCNYAFQFFISLFHEEDELYITYVSHPNKTYNYTIQDNRQILVDTFRNHNGGVTSSIESIKAGYKKLQNSQGGPNDTYWLLVLSDGEIYNEEGNLTNTEYLDRYFNIYTNQKMPNGTDVNIFFVGIGEECVLPTENLDKKISVSHAKDSSSLVDIVNDFASKISGCLNIDDIACITKKIDGKEVFFDTQVPIDRLIVVVKNSDSQIVNIQSSDKDYTVSEKVSMGYSHLNYGKGLVNSLVGSVSYIDVESGMDKGGYKITLDKEVSAENVTIYYRPSLEVRFSIQEYSTGAKIDNIYDLSTGDEISISYEVFEKGTDKVVDIQNLLDSVNSRFEIFNEGTLVTQDNTTSKIISYYKITENEQRIQAFITLGGLISIGNVIDISMYDLRIVENESVSRFDLISRKQPIKLKLYKNDAVVTGSNLNKLFLDYTVNSNININSCFNSDGTIDIIPTYGDDNLISKLWYGWKAAWDVQAQDYEINIIIKDANQMVKIEDTVLLKVNQKDVLFTVFCFMFPWVIIGLILGYRLKRRFNLHLMLFRVELCTQNQDYIGNKEDWQYERFVISGFKNIIRWTSMYTLIPFVRNKKKIGGITFKAGKIVNGNETISFKTNGHCIYLVKEAHLVSLQDVALLIQDQNIIDVSHKDIITVGLGDAFIIQDGEHFYLHKLSKGGF